MTKADVLEIKNFLQTEGGLKVTIKKHGLSSSMRGYVSFRVVGRTNEWEWDFCQRLRKLYKAPEPYPTFVSNKTEMSIYVGNELYNMEFRRKRTKRPKVETPDLSVPYVPQTGINSVKHRSQVRLDKSVSRYAKRLRNGTGGARYW